MCKIDWVTGIMLIVVFSSVLFTLFVAVPKFSEAGRLCIENGYTKYKVYFSDDSIYCLRKGEMSKDEVVRIK
jgi:hypothetical protein